MSMKAALLIAAGLWLAGCKQPRDAYAVTTTDTLIRFQTDDANIEDEHPITGLDAGETLQQIDFRPDDGKLYGLTSNTRIVTVDPGSGVATAVGTATASGSPSTTLTNEVLDVNPQGDYLRVIGTQASTTDSSSTQAVNERVDPATGAVTTVDSTSLRFNDNDTNQGETPVIVAIAHTNDREHATSTTEYGLELTTQSLVRITTSGVLSTIGTVRGFTVNSGFDIVRDRGDNDGDNGLAYIAVSEAGGDAELYEFDLTDGSSKSGSSIGSNRQIRSLAVALNPPKRQGFSQ